MKHLAIATMLAGCTTTPASSLKPGIQVGTEESKLGVGASFEGDPDVSGKATFRGATYSLRHEAKGAYGVWIDLDRPVETDEPVGIEIDGIAMEITAPPAFDNVQVPPFISRTKPATISWTSTSDDPMSWYVLSAWCAQGAGQIAAGSASVTFAATDWMPGVEADYMPICTTTVRLLRDRTVPIDPAFGGGGLVFEQYFDTYFASMP